MNSIWVAVLVCCRKIKSNLLWHGRRWPRRLMHCLNSWLMPVLKQESLKMCGTKKNTNWVSSSLQPSWLWKFVLSCFMLCSQNAVRPQVFRNIRSSFGFSSCKLIEKRGSSWAWIASPPCCVSQGEAVWASAQCSESLSFYFILWQHCNAYKFHTTRKEKRGSKLSTEVMSGQCIVLWVVCPIPPEPNNYRIGLLF